MPVPVISVAQMREWEAASWRAGRSQAEVIAQAGRAVAETALQMTSREDRILIMAGRGHNGDDARAAQAHLAGRRVKLCNMSEPAAALAELNDLLAERPALVIDGLFGIGLNRPLDPAHTDLIEHLNTANLPVLAIDVPSGLDADTGEPKNVALCAAATVTLGAPKRGLLKAGAWPFTGRLEVAAKIGLTPCEESSELQWTLAEDFEGFPPARRVDGHKGTFGHVAILAGSPGYHGAAVLSARGALRACPGLVSMFTDARVYGPVAGQLQAAMVHSWDPENSLPASCTAVLIGPGLAARDLPPAWREVANEYWQTSPHPVVADASALDWIQPGATPLNSRRFLTPHPGEAARLLGRKADAVQADRVAALRELSSRYGNCWVVLKGHQTLIGRSSGDVFVNSTGNPYLGQGGSGDLLAGFLTGLLARPKLQAQPLKTARYAVWEHGAAADRLSARCKSWTVEELMSELGAE